MKTLKELKEEAKRLVESVADKPQGRYQLRKKYYSKFGFGNCWNKSGYGNSELDFLQWEIKRGVLNPLNSNQPGSPWWRAVNLEFIYNSELAGLIYENHINRVGLSPQVLLWLDYIDHPNEDSWYRAHNSSIINGYYNQRYLAYEESLYEIAFINMVLYRVLFAQAMVEDKTIFGDYGSILANPIFDGVEIIVSLKDFYPKNYPLTEKDFKELIGRKFSLEDTLVNILDQELIKPHLTNMYLNAAYINNTPNLVYFQKNNEPNYPCIIK